MSNFERTMKQSSKFESFNDENPKCNDEKNSLRRMNDNDQIFNEQNKINDQRIVYVGNLPTEELSDQELFDFFKPYGKICDIRVYKRYLFVQYYRIEDAQQLIEQREKCLFLKGNRLEILSSMEKNSSGNGNGNGNVLNRSSSLIVDLSKDHFKNSRRSFDEDQQRSSFFDQPPRKKFSHHSNFHQDKDFYPKSSNFSSLSSMEMKDLKSNEKELVHCQILIVNPRQRKYAEKICSLLYLSDLRRHIHLLPEDLTLTKAIENVSQQNYLYAILAMPIHEEQHRASFHILHPQREEYRNWILEDGIQLILQHFSRYQRNLSEKEKEKEKMKSSKIESRRKCLISTATSTGKDFESINRLELNDRLPLGSLLCLLADGRQLTLEEIDRILVYLFDKKGQMLTLPQGILPPLPSQYAKKSSIEQRNSFESKSKKEISSELFKEENKNEIIAEKICEILSSNLLKNSSNQTEENSFPKDIENPFNSLINEKSFAFPIKRNSMENSFAFTNSNFSISNSFDRTNLSNSTFSPSTSTRNEQISSHFRTNSAADRAAAILQAYSQFNARLTTSADQNNSTTIHNQQQQQQHFQH